MSEFYLLGQIALALILGGIMGWQREQSGKAAGPRTQALVTAGSTMFIVIILHALGKAEAGRVAAQVVTGIGFIGAGTIIHRSDRVEGVTTASGLWIATGVGMAIAFEYYIVAIITTLLIFGVLSIREKGFKIKAKD